MPHYTVLKPSLIRRCVASLIFAITIVAFLATNLRAAQIVSYPFQGVTLIHRTETSPRKLDIWVALIDTLAPGIRFSVTNESPYAADTVVAQTTRSYLSQTGAQLAINGDFFSSAGTYNGLAHVNPSGFVASAGNIYSAFDPSRPSFHIGKNNVAHLVTGSSTTPNPAVPVWNAVGGADYLINNGALPTYWNNPSHHRYAFANANRARTAIGMTSDRRTIAMFVVDEGNPSSAGMKFSEVATMLRNDYNMHWAINLDGGGSTTMAISDPVARNLNDPSDGNGRSVANNLALFARPTPAPVPANAKSRSFVEDSAGYSHVGAQISSSAPNVNYGETDSFRVGFDLTLGRSRGVLSFDLSDIPASATIHSVSLALDAYSVSNAINHRTVDLEIYKLTGPIVESELTWNRSAAGNNWSSPGGNYTGQSLSSLVAQTTTGTKQFVSTVAFVNAAQQALNSGQPLSLLVAALDAESWGASDFSNLNMTFRSDDATLGLAPRLTIQYTFPIVPGDFNEDGVVDSADYIVWRKGLASGQYNQSHYNTWRANFGRISGDGSGSSSPAPEPATAAMLIGGVIGTLALRRRRPGTPCFFI